MKYQLTSSAALKLAGLAITTPLAVAGLKPDLTAPGLLATSSFATFSLVFFLISLNYLERLEDLVEIGRAHV